MNHPSGHARLSAAERHLIVAGRGDTESTARPKPRWRDLLQLPQTWGLVIARAFTHPMFFFDADWFPIYLVTKGILLRNSLFVIWTPFVGTDIGNFFDGWLSGHLIARGHSMGWACKGIVFVGAISVTALIPTIFTSDLRWLILLLSVSCLC